MKNLLILIFCLCLFTCCTDSIINEQQQAQEETDAVTIKGEHLVRYSDIVTLSRGLSGRTRSDVQGADMIECITDEFSDTVLYVIMKPSGGWTIYSSDMRVPPIVAQSDSGTFENLMQVDGARLWLQSMAEDMTVIRNLPDENLNFSEKEILNNKSFWESISFPDKYVRETLIPETRAKIGVPTELITGHYEYSYSETYSEVYDSIPRLTSTNWSQNLPYNYYCPLKSNNNSRAPAGCVAIAGAQMLYWLHDSYGVPEVAPSEAYCDGNIYSYTWDQTNFTSEIWDEMVLNGFKAAPLIANVGKLLNMNYGDKSSGAYTVDLVDNVFATYGISCVYSDYDTELLKSNLANNIPVLLDARSIDSSSTESEKVGHAFIADRYKRTQIVTVNYYEWIYDSYPSNTPIPMIPDKIEYKYSTPKISMIGINWGWGSSCNLDDEWFSLTGDWISRYNDTYNWNINRHMIYGFEVNGN